MTVATNLGGGGSALDAQYGSSASANTNEPLLLTHTGTNYLYVPGSFNNNATTPDSAALSITGDIDIKVRVAMDDWTPASTSTLVSKFYTAGSQRSYALFVLSSGVVRFSTSPDGTSGATIGADSTIATGVTDGSIKWVRVTRDVDDGSSQRVTKFYLSDNGTTWTQLGTTITTAGTTSQFDSTAPLEIGTVEGGSHLAGKFYEVIIQSAFDTTDNTTSLVFDADFTTGIASGGQTSFTESSTNAATVTISRSSSGRKSVAVVRPIWLFGTDDYFEVADSSLLDFAAADDWTVWCVGRAFGTTADDTLIAKQDGTAAADTGWALDMGTSSVTRARIADGTTTQNQTTTARTAGALTLWAAVKSGTTLTPYLGSTAGSALTITVAGSLANSDVMRIGRLSGAGTNYHDGEIVAAAVHRRALSASEIAAIAAYYGV